MPSAHVPRTQFMLRRALTSLLLLASLALTACAAEPAETAAKNGDAASAEGQDSNAPQTMTAAQAMEFCEGLDDFFKERCKVTLPWALAFDALLERPELAALAESLDGAYPPAPPRTAAVEPFHGEAFSLAAKLFPLRADHDGEKTVNPDFAIGYSIRSYVDVHRRTMAHQAATKKFYIQRTERGAKRLIGETQADNIAEMTAEQARDVLTADFFRARFVSFFMVHQDLMLGALQQQLNYNTIAEVYERYPNPDEMEGLHNKWIGRLEPRLDALKGDATFLLKLVDRLDS